MRTRTLMAKTAASLAFGELKENYRIGFDTIWERSTFDIPVGTDGGLFKNTNRSTWFSRLFGATANGGTHDDRSDVDEGPSASEHAPTLGRMQHVDTVGALRESGPRRVPAGTRRPHSPARPAG